jgi:hypothetical protein
MEKVFKSKVCKQCDVTYVPTSSTQRFCTVACSAKHPQRCSACKVIKRPEHFYHRGDGRISRYCKPCEKERNLSPERQTYEHSPERIAAKSAYQKTWRDNLTADQKNELKRKARQYRITKMYNLNSEDYEAMYEKQNGCCAICTLPESEQRRNLDIDHDRSCCPGRESCGKCVRGLLCESCNKLLGLSKDDATILSYAIRYLQTTMKGKE